MGEIVHAIMDGTIFHLSFVVKFQSISFSFRSLNVPISDWNVADTMPIKYYIYLSLSCSMKVLFGHNLLSVANYIVLFSIEEL